MTRGTEKHLLKQFVAGNVEAFGALVERKRRIVRRFIAAGLPPGQDVDAFETEVFGKAHAELPKLDLDEEDLTIFLLDLLRDIAFQKLPDVDYRQTIFSTGRDTFSSPPRLPSVPHAVLTGEEPPSIDSWLRCIDDRQQLLLELVFLEAAPLKGVAELVNCSETILQSYLYHVLDGMGELAALSHGAGCPPDLLLGMEVVRARAQRQKIARLREERADCHGCTTLIERCVALVTLWGQEWRPEPEELQALLERAVPGTKGRLAARRPVQEFVALEPQTTPQTSRATGTFFLGLLLIAFVGGSIYWLKDRAPGTEGGRRPDGGGTTGQVRPGTPERRLPTRVGTLSSASAASEPLYDGSSVATDQRNPATLAFENGVRVELSPNGAGKATSAGFQLMSGIAHVEVPAGVKPPFNVLSGDVQLQSAGANLSIVRTPGRRTVLAVERGTATLTLPDGRSVSLEPGRQASIDLATGHSTVSDYNPADFSPLGRADSAARPQPQGSGAPPKEGGGEGQEGPASPFGGGGVQPADVRGFRDAF